MNKPYIYILLLTSLLLASCGGDDGLDSPKHGSSTNQGQGEMSEVIDSTYEYQLPIIFHVFYQDKDNASQYIPAARLKNLLSYVNQIYQGGIYGESANTHIRFELAKRDESGRPLPVPGVEYVYYSGEYPIDEVSFMSSKDHTKYIWDPNKYINVMLYPFKKKDSGEVLGISHMPFTPKGDKKLEGLEEIEGRYISKKQLGFPLCSSINSIYAGQSPSGEYYQSNRYTAIGHQTKSIVASDVVVTLAHELGHYLGLFHIFTENIRNTHDADIFNFADSCADTDYCKDTPSYNRSEYNAYLDHYLATTQPEMLNVWDVLKRSACDASQFHSANIMDYAFTLGYKISKEQKARMRHVLYYSPLIPGPKKNGINRKTRATNGSQDIIYSHPRLIR